MISEFGEETYDSRIGIERLQYQAQQFRESTDHFLNRGVIGELLLEEAGCIPWHLDLLEKLNEAAAALATARQKSAPEGAPWTGPKRKRPADQRITGRWSKRLSLHRPALGDPDELGDSMDPVSPRSQALSIPLGVDCVNKTPKLRDDRKKTPPGTPNTPCTEATITDDVVDLTIDDDTSTYTQHSGGQVSACQVSRFWSESLPSRPKPIAAGAIDEEISDSYAPLEKREAFWCVRALIKQHAYYGAEALLAKLDSIEGMSLPSRLAVADLLYTAGQFGQVISVLRVPELAAHSPTAARVEHILAKTYFAMGDMGRAIQFSQFIIEREADLDRRHPYYLESMELLAQIWGSFDGAAAKTIRIKHFSSPQQRFLEQLDDIEDAFKPSNNPTRRTLTKLLSGLLPTKELFPPQISELGPYQTWNFEKTVLGFHDGKSILTILYDLSAFDLFELLCLRANVTNNLSPGRTRLALDTILRWATFHDKPALAEIVVNAGADIEAEMSMKSWCDIRADCEGMTPLHIAARFGHYASGLIKFLLGHGANLNVKDYQGRTALRLAEINGHVEVMRYLEGVGAKM